MYYRILGTLLILFSMIHPTYAKGPIVEDTSGIALQQMPGFFRFTFDNLSMPNNDQSMGLLGVNYFSQITPQFYAGASGYGAVTGTQGGLFVLGIAGGYQQPLFGNLWGDIGLFVGGGGGKSSLVGGGLMLRPSAGLIYHWPWVNLGVHYSYIDFPNGKIHSQQIGLDFEIPADFYYLYPHAHPCPLFNLDNLRLPLDKFLAFQRNDFAILVQAYKQRPGTLNTDNEVQDGTIYLVGAEFDHYFTDNTFWWLKSAGAFSGIPNGYMDVLGGLGYHWQLPHLGGVALVPELGIGAGGGGMVNSGGGFLINPQLGLEIPLLRSIAFRLNSGYMWSPKGDFKVVPITGELLYHLNFASAGNTPLTQPKNYYDILGWRIQAFNQTYFHVQRTAHATTSPINLIGIQIDQIFTPYFFFTYQAAAAYSGYHAGGYATGMIGPGLQSQEWHRLQLFAEALVGAGGGGGLALNGGSLIEPVVGLRYAFTPVIGLQASASEVKAFRDNLNTFAANIGITIRFDTLNGL